MTCGKVCRYGGGEPFIMAGHNKTFGLTLAAIGLGIFVACITPVGILAIIEGIVLVMLGWVLFRRG